MIPLLLTILTIYATSLPSGVLGGALPAVAVGFNDDSIARVEKNMLNISTHRYCTTKISLSSM